MQTIKLTPEDKRLLGKVTGKEDVAIICDSTNAAFEVDLYDASMATGINFYILNIGANVVTLNSPVGQYLNDVWSVTLAQWDCYSAIPADNKWYILNLKTANPTFNSIQLSTSPVSIPTAIGTLYYDPTDNTLAVILPNGVINQISEEVFFGVLNKSGSKMLNGKLVYIDGVQGNRVTAAYATNATCASASRCIAMLTQDIENNQIGKATFIGLVRGLNTQGITEGTELWLSTNGDYTTTQPAVGTARVRIGRLVKEHVNDGHILVFIQQDKYMFGDRDGGNYSIFDDNGYLEHYNLARPYEDLNFDVVNSGGPAANVPDAVTINDVSYREFTSANNQHCSGCKEIYHAAYIKTAQALIAHTHIFLKGGESSGTTGVTFTIYWELRQTTGTTNGNVAVSATSAQLAANANKIDLYASTSFNGPIELGAQLTMRLARTGGDAGDVIATTYGVHVALDAGGSKTATSK